VLPIGGSATRMQGLPKFLLPYDHNSLLIEKHIQAGIDASFDSVVVIVRDVFFDTTSQYLEKFGSKVKVISLPYQTRTMCETLLDGLSSIDLSEDDLLVIALSDTALEASKYRSIYENAVAVNDNPFLVLFEAAEFQLGKLGQVSLDNKGTVVAMSDKEPDCKFPYFWGLAGFPASFLHKLDMNEAHIGISIQRWLEEGQAVLGILSDSKYFDCGTFDEYRKHINSI
jgi:hypothetical protein